MLYSMLFFVPLATMKKALFLALLLPSLAFSQGNFRLRADVTIKEVNKEAGTQNLWKGKVYYDKTNETLLYDFFFPYKSVWYMNKKTLYDIRRDTVKAEKKNAIRLESTIFHLALEHNMNQFGLEKFIYELGDTKRDGDMVISEWKPKANFAPAFGEVHLSNKNGKLYGVLAFSPEKTIVRKQFFRQYQRVGNIDFPSEQIEFIYLEEGGEIKRLTTYKNIVINELANEEYYQFDVSGYVVDK